MKHFVLTLIASTALFTQAMGQGKVTNVSTNTAKLNIEALQNQEQTARLSRFLYAGYNTLCLPMTLTAEQMAKAAKDARIERLVAIKQEGSTLNLYFVDCTEEGVQAGVPYLIYSPTKQYLQATNNEAQTVSSTLKAIRLNDGEGNQVTFSSSWENMAKNGRYGIPAQQPVTPLESVLIKTEGDKQFLPTRCGFSWDQQASSATELKIVHMEDMGEVTAIVGIEKAQAGAAYYDLNGRKINGQAKKGVFITGGDKVLVK